MLQVTSDDITSDKRKLYMHPTRDREIKYWHKTTTGK